jgi:glucan biosynthesis protein C
MNQPTAQGPTSEETGIRGASHTQLPRTRLLYIENLRWTMILLVISMHAADTYSPFGNWYYVDRSPMSLATILIFGAWQMYLQSFFMGLLFFIAGYFVPGSYDRKGPAGFLRDRTIRLGLPVLLYMFVIGPITEYYVAHSWTSTEPTSFANEWVTLNARFCKP